jgi:monomeric isocitrate dehydrogenase
MYKDKESRKIYREKNKEKIAAQVKKYALEHKEQIKKWKMENKEKIAQKSHEHYLKNRDKTLIRDREWWKHFRDHLFMGKKCQECNAEKDLVFHHLDPNTKDTDVTRLKRKSEEEIQKEIVKCVVLCRSCHMKLHDPHKWRER